MYTVDLSDPTNAITEAHASALREILEVALTVSPDVLCNDRWCKFTAGRGSAVDFANLGHWYADSHAGRARGLSVDDYGVPEHRASGSRDTGFDALAAGTGLSYSVMVGVFASDAMRIKLDDAVLWEDDGARSVRGDAQRQALGRLHALLGAPRARRVLSSR